MNTSNKRKDTAIPSAIPNIAPYIRRHDTSTAITPDPQFSIMPLMYGALAGATGTAVSHPFDTWAVHRATNRTLPWKTPLAFYRGLPPAVLQGALVYGLLLGTYEKLILDYEFTWYTASLLSTIPESITRGPLEAVKNMQQTLYRPTGVKLISTLAKGTMGTFARECPGNLVYFGTFSYLKRTTELSTLSAAALTGAIFGATVYPLEAMRTQVATGKALVPTYVGAMPYIARSVTMITTTFFAFKLYSGKDLGEE